LLDVWGKVVASGGPHLGGTRAADTGSAGPRETGEDRTMPEGWSDKRERQYEHIKDSYKDRGVSTDEAEERAARTVNKERREDGETKKQGD
jgi:hypothetical protein